MKYILILHHKLYDNEILFVHRLIESLKLSNINILDLSSEHIDIDIDNIDRIIRIFDYTKTVSPFQKSYNSLNIPDSIPTMDIPRPSTLAKDLDMQDKVWKDLQAFCPRVFDEKILDQMTNHDFKLVVSHLKENTNKYYYITANDTKFEIRPDNMDAIAEPSITYSEFFYLLLIKYMFKTDKIEIS